MIGPFVLAGLTLAACGKPKGPDWSDKPLERRTIRFDGMAASIAMPKELVPSGHTEGWSKTFDDKEMLGPNVLVVEESRSFPTLDSYVHSQPTDSDDEVVRKVEGNHRYSVTIRNKKGTMVRANSLLIQGDKELDCMATQGTSKDKVISDAMAAYLEKICDSTQIE